MMLLIDRSRPYRTLLKVVVILLAAEYSVRGPFFQRYIVPREVSPFVMLRERTAGRQPSLLIDVLRHMPAKNIRVAFLGDSVMLALDGDDRSTVPYRLTNELRERFRRPGIQAIDCSEVGLYAADATLMASKLVGAGADVLVYGVLLRALPRDPDVRRVTQVSSQLGAMDLWRLVRVGGTQWLARNLSGEDVIGGIVHENWATYAYRSSLRRVLWEDGLHRIFPAGSLVEQVVNPRPLPPHAATAPRAPRASPFEWTRSEYGPPSANWDAVDLFGRLCQRYAPGRCVLYSSPINPLGREQASEPGLQEEYLAFLRLTATRYGLIFRDYTDALTPSEFLPPKYGGLRDAVHMNPEGRAKLTALLVEPAAEAVAQALSAPGRAER
jgi:hypothetical protein